MSEQIDNITIKNPDIKFEKKLMGDLPVLEIVLTNKRDAVKIAPGTKESLQPILSTMTLAEIKGLKNTCVIYFDTSGNLKLGEADVNMNRASDVFDSLHAQGYRVVLINHIHDASLPDKMNPVALDRLMKHPAVWVEYNYFETGEGLKNYARILHKSREYGVKKGLTQEKKVLLEQLKTSRVTHVTSLNEAAEQSIHFIEAMGDGKLNSEDAIKSVDAILSKRVGPTPEA